MNTLPKWVTAAACLLIALTAVVLPALADDVEWTAGSYEEILEKAQAENRPILIDFYTTWCGPCKRLDKDTYSNAAAVAFIEKTTIPVKYDSEKGAGIDISKRYRVGQWPTIMLLDPKGNEIDRIVGYFGPEDFVKMVGDYQKGLNTVAYFEAHVKEHPKDVEAWKTLGKKYADAARGAEANAAYVKYLELTPDLSGEEKTEALFSIGEAYYLDKSYAEAAGVFEGILEASPEPEIRDETTTLLARCYYGLGEVEKCVTTYKAYADRHQDDARACNSFAWFCASRKVGLDEALPVALRAVELTERDPGYLDTLAELYYARGEFDNAIKIGQEALDQDPEDQYFRDQVDKFRKAKEEADKRASK